MRSSIKIDFADQHGKGVIEPVIRVNIVNSEDPRDGLLKRLFSPGLSHLQIQYTHHEHIAVNGEPDMNKTLILCQPFLTDDDKKLAQEYLQEVDRIIDNGTPDEKTEFLKRERAKYSEKTFQ